MHRMYISTWFTCLTHTAKMVLFTGLEHSDNTSTLEQSRGVVGGVVHSVNENLCFRVFKHQVKVINKNVGCMYSV